MTTAEIERVVRDAWSRALKVAEPDPDLDFFAAGGSSLDAAQLVSSLRGKLPVQVTLMTVFENPTLAAFLAAASDPDPLR